MESRSKILLKRSRPFALFACLALFGCAPHGVDGRERHVVVIVWDGMRPDFVSKANTPTLWNLARQGVTFRHHHSTYLSATEVNGTAIATGAYPSRSGIIANYSFRPKIDPEKMVDAGDPAVVQKGDDVSGGKYIAVPTIAEILHRAGKRTAIAGTKHVALLQDRRALPDQPGGDSFVLFQGEVRPGLSPNPFQELLGAFPGLIYPQADEWTTRALTNVMWKTGVPEYSLLWLGQPDDTQHKTSPGSPASIAAVQSADKHLNDVLQVLEQKKVRETTDVFVVSDHGFSTIEESIDLVPQLNQAGFHAVTRLDATQTNDAEIMVVGNGGSVLFYLLNRKPETASRLVSWLQQTSFAGVIFAREKIEGTFPLDTALINTPDAPDVVMAFQWNPKPNQFGCPGMIKADWQRQAGGGTHASLSEFDIHNLLIAAGPDLKPEMNDELPSGNTDLTPTILHILGIDAPGQFDGRVLSEALRGSTAPSQKAEQESHEAHRDLGEFSWQQHLRISRVGSTIYLDEGNGSSSPKPHP